MKKIILILSVVLISGSCLAAGTTSSSGKNNNDYGSDRDEINLYKDGEKLIKRASIKDKEWGIKKQRIIKNQ